MLDPCPLCSDGAQEAIEQALGYMVRKVAAVNERSGGWCDDCLLPSVWTVDVVARCAHGWPVMSIGEWHMCDECGRQWGDRIRH